MVGLCPTMSDDIRELPKTHKPRRLRGKTILLAICRVFRAEFFDG